MIHSLDIQASYLPRESSDTPQCSLCMDTTNSINSLRVYNVYIKPKCIKVSIIPEMIVAKLA